MFLLIHIFIICMYILYTCVYKHLKIYFCEVPTWGRGMALVLRVVGLPTGLLLPV